MKNKLFAFALILVSFAVKAEFLPAHHPEATKTNETFSWAFASIDDGLFFLLGPESTYFLNIHVKPYTAEGKPSDTVTVLCNAGKYRISAGESLDCYGNYVDVISMSIRADDFANGAEGVYTFKYNH